MDMGKMHRKAVESLYSGICTVYEHRKVKDAGTKLTGFEDILVLENQPCRLSFERINAAVQGESAAGVSQAIKLFLSPEIVIKPGSEITVTQNGITADYTSSGVPAVYQSHQEIILELEEERA